MFFLHTHTHTHTPHSRTHWVALMLVVHTASAVFSAHYFSSTNRFSCVILRGAWEAAGPNTCLILFSFLFLFILCLFSSGYIFTLLFFFRFSLALYYNTPTNMSRAYALLWVDRAVCSVCVYDYIYTFRRHSIAECYIDGAFSPSCNEYYTINLPNAHVHTEYVYRMRPWWIVMLMHIVLCALCGTDTVVHLILLLPFSWRNDSIRKKWREFRRRICFLCHIAAYTAPQ